MVWNPDAESVVHGISNTIVQVHAVGRREALEAADTGFPVPRTHADRIEMVDSIGQTESAHEGLEADAAGHDHDGAAAQPLKRSAQPAQKTVDPIRIVVAAAEALQEDRQFVDHQQHGAVVRRAPAKKILTMSPPTSGIQPGAELYAEIERAQLVDVLREPVPHGRCHALRDRANGVQHPRQIRNHVLGTGCTLDIDEQEEPAVSLQASAEFLQEAGLAHAPLPGHQQVIPVANQSVNHAQFAVTVEEVIAADPAAGRESHSPSSSDFAARIPHNTTQMTTTLLTT